MNISYRFRSLIYGVSGHSINQGCQKCDRCKGRGNKGVKEKQQGEVYINKEHREAGSERNKR